MNNVSIKSILVQPTYLLCITTEGQVVTLTEPDKIDWVMHNALPLFTNNPNSILDLDLDNITSSVLITKRDGQPIVLGFNSIKTQDKEYEIPTTSLVKFINYAEKNDYSISPLVQKITESLDEGQNESMKDLLTFLDRNELPITVNGNILAFKVLNKSKDPEVFYDCHTNMIAQRVGDVIQMPRALVCTDRTVHCSNGLHVCSIDYIRGFYTAGSTVLALVLVEPKDICSVPTDTNSKVRCNRYQILGIVPEDEILYVLNKHIEPATKFQELFNLALNEEFAGINRVINLSKPTISSISEIFVKDVNSFHIRDKKYEAKVASLVKKDEDPSSLYRVLLKSRDLAKNPSLLKNKEYLKELKVFKNKYTWKELGIDDIMRKRITRRWKKYGIN